MKKQLLAYQISGQTVGIDISTWNLLDLNGNKPFTYIISGDTVPNNYVDITSITNWEKFGINFANDYSTIKYVIKEIVDASNWDSLSDIEKDLTIKYSCYPNDVKAVTYLMTKHGITQNEGSTMLLKSWYAHHIKSIESYQQRWNHCKYTTLLYLYSSDCEDLFNTIEVLIDAYVKLGVVGKAFGDNRSGIIDYILSTNDFVEQGLEYNDYILVQGTFDELKTALYNVLVEGIYDKTM